MADPVRTLVSVIIPVYNGEKYIAETIQSVLVQTHKLWELIIVDDGSTDGLKKIVEKYQNVDLRIKYYYCENRGVSSARNFGIKVSKGDLIAFLDADDIWLPENLAIKIEKIGNNSYGLVHSDAFILRNGEESNQEKLTGMEGWLLDDMLLCENTQIPGPSSVLIKRKVIEQVGLFDEKMSTTADKDFFIRVAAKFEIGRINRCTWYYRIHENNMHKDIGLMERDTIYLYKKLSRNHIFRDRKLEKKCYSNMYLILAASWLGDGKNILKFSKYLFKVLIYNPTIFFKLLSKLWNKWFSN